MAIVQISRITQRKGLQENLPQLAGAELGWSIDERRLFIGNGTLAEGAPVVGNTEILTEFSDIIALNTFYTYKGEAAGYTAQTGPTPGTPISQSLQSWLDQFASVTDFGAVGDGVTDDTDAINRALYQIYCREVNTQIRRGLFFPAGVYLVTSSIKIPPFAYLCGEGADASIIRLDDSASYVAQTCDSLQQTGANIGTNGALIPQYITMANMALESTDSTADIFLIEDANNCRFQSVRFSGPLTIADLDTDADDIACIRFAGTTSFICEQIIFDQCYFEGTTYGINTNEQVNAAVVSNSRFDTLFQGILLGYGSVSNGGATGFRINNSVFDNIYAEGIIFGLVSLNTSNTNIFYDVGNHFNGVTNPATVIINIQSDGNSSIGDVFQRTDAYSAVYKRVEINNTLSTSAFASSIGLAMGSYVMRSGRRTTLTNATTNGTVTTFVTTAAQAFSVNYTIVRDTATQTGTIMVATQAVDSTGDLSYSIDYTENSATGVTLSLIQSGTTITLRYTTTNTGSSGVISYFINYPT